MTFASGNDGMRHSNPDVSAQCTRPWICEIHTLCDDYSPVVISSFIGSIFQDVSINDMALPHLSSIQCLQSIDHLLAHLQMMFNSCHNHTCYSHPHAHIVMTRPTFVSHSKRTQCEPNKHVMHQKSKDISPLERLTPWMIRAFCLPSS